jgi:hypothetical protein
MVFAASRFPSVSVPSALVTDVGRGWQGLPTAAFAISHSTAGELPNSVSLARLEASLSRLTIAVTLFLAALYGGRGEGIPLGHQGKRIGTQVEREQPLSDRDGLNGGGLVQAVDNPPSDEVQDLVRVPDPIHVRPRPGIQRTEECRPLKGFKIPPLHGLQGGGNLVDLDGRDHGVVVGRRVGEDGHCGLEVPRHADVVEDRLMDPCLSILSLVTCLVELNGGRFSFSLCTMQQQIECWKLGII